MLRLFQRHHHDRLRSHGAANRVGKDRGHDLRLFRDPRLHPLLHEHGQGPLQDAQVDLHQSVQVSMGGFPQYF